MDSEGRSVPLAALTAAARGKRWDFVDDHILQAITPENIRWAMRAGIEDINSDVRDLAATILHHCDDPLEGGTLSVVTRRIEVDPNKYVKYRLAMALWRRGTRPDVIRRLIGDALADPEISPAVKEFLQEFPDAR